MTLFLPAPPLDQFTDEQVLLEMAEIVRPGFLIRRPGENGVFMVLAGDVKDATARAAVEKVAAEGFQILLGLLRAWRPIAGKRRDEVQSGIGSGNWRDEYGNQFGVFSRALEYSVVEGEIAEYAAIARRAIETSRNLRNALWLNGRRDRSAADAYMIYEYAEREFSKDKMAKALGVARSDLVRLRSSANNLAPTQGGRHIGQEHDAPWNLDDVLAFVGRCLSGWIRNANQSSTETPDRETGSR